MGVRRGVVLVVGVRLRRIGWRTWPLNGPNGLTNKVHWLFSSTTRSATLRVGEDFFPLFSLFEPISDGDMTDGSR